MIIEVLIYILIFVTVVPLSSLLIKLCDDEIILDKKYFNYFFYFLIFVLLLFLIFYREISMILSIVYLIVLIYLMSIKKHK
jgi:hypothetical protein